jgi:hypothetical protein
MSRPRSTASMQLFLVAAAILVAAAAIAGLARRPELQVRLDATKTRAYSLSPQTRELLAGLEGSWRIAVILSESDADERIRRQVDEVLRRFRAAAPSLEVTNVDPSNPASLAAYEGLLARLQAMEQGSIDAYESRLDAAAAVFDEVLLYAQRISADLQALLGMLPEGDPRREPLVARGGFMTALARDGGQLTAEVAAARQPGEEVPLPRYDVARSILREACSQTADEVQAIGDALDEIGRSTTLEPRVRIYAREESAVARSLATRLLVAGEALVDLPELQSSRVAGQLSVGEAAVVMGPPGAAVIPSEQLLPRMALDAGAGSAAFDRRFEGEQVIGAAIRSLLVDTVPMAVFVHADEGSILASRPDATDTVGLQRAMERAGIAVREWAVVRGERPVAEPGQPVAWIVVPPLRRTELTPAAAEQRLIDAARSLLVAGEPVLLSLNPSRLPQFRQVEPWARLLEGVGVATDPSRVLLEATPITAGEFAVAASIALDRSGGRHPLSGVLDGQRLTLPVPVPLLAAPDAPGEAAAMSGDVEVVVAVEPAAGRWLEADWGSGRLPAAPPAGAGLPGPTPLIVALERPHPAGPDVAAAVTGRQRLLVVGSGSWMRSRTADAIADLGNGRAALVSPGNHELALAGVAWLTGQDDRVAASSAGGQVSRLSGIDRTVRMRWAVGTVVAGPLVIVLLGTGGWWWRRRAS